jgi:hypothetical protein
LQFHLQKKIGKLQKKSGTAIGFAAPDSVLLSADATYFRNRLRMMSVPSLIPPPTSTHSKINPNKPPIQHTSFLKKNDRLSVFLQVHCIIPIIQK